jgi:hypothetical protein
MQKTKVTVNFVCENGEEVVIQMPLFKCNAYSSVIAQCYESSGEDPLQWPMPYRKEGALAVKIFVEHEINWVPIVEARTPEEVEAEEGVIDVSKKADLPIDFEEVKGEFMKEPGDFFEKWRLTFADDDIRRDINYIALYLDIRSLMHLGLHLLADTFIDTSVGENGNVKRTLMPIETIKKIWAVKYNQLTGKDINNPDPADLAEVHRLFPWLLERNFPPPSAPQASIEPQPMEE